MGEWLAVRMLKTSCNFNDQQTLGEGTQPARAAGAVGGTCTGLRLVQGYP